MFLVCNPYWKTDVRREYEQKFAMEFKREKCICGHCGMKGAKMKCRGCEIVWYCNNKCQRSDRKKHKAKCGKNNITGGLISRCSMGLKRYLCLHCHAVLSVEPNCKEGKQMKGEGCPRCKIHHSFLKKLSTLEFEQFNNKNGANDDLYSTYKTPDGTVKHYRLKGLGSV